MLKNDLLKHKIFTLRYAGTLSRSLQMFLSKATDEAKKELRIYPYGLSKIQLNNLESRLLQKCDLEIDKQFEALDSLMQYEVRFIAGRLEKYGFLEDTILPSHASLSKALYNTKMGVISGENDKAVLVAYKQFLKKKIKEIVLVVGDLSVNTRR